VLNIQRLGKTFEIDEENLYSQIMLFTKWFCWEDCHSFDQCAHFCIDEEGKVRMVDYGSLAAQEVIRRFGKTCHEGISLDLQRSEEFEKAVDEAAAEWQEYRRNRKTASARE
jgi:hypothetical protein